LFFQEIILRINLSQSAMLHGSYRIAHGLYMVYSITNRESFIELEHYLTVAEQAKESDRFPVIIAG
jgi:GTPase SAR1 family protein